MMSYRHVQEGAMGMLSSPSHPCHSPTDACRPPPPRPHLQEEKGDAHQGQGRLKALKDRAVVRVVDVGPHVGL